MWKKVDGSHIIKWGDDQEPTLKLTFAHAIYDQGFINLVTHYIVPNLAIKACRIDCVYGIYFWFSFYCASASFINKIMYLDPANPLYYRFILSINTMYVSRKLGQGGTIFSKPKKMCVQNPV